jgi:hypothetical protein
MTCIYQDLLTQLPAEGYLSYIQDQDFFLAVLEFELMVSGLLVRHSTTWATLPDRFCVGYFQDRVSLPGWPQTSILWISTSQLARIIDVSLWHPAQFQAFPNIMSKFVCEQAFSFLRDRCPGVQLLGHVACLCCLRNSPVALSLYLPPRSVSD